jgi:ribosomal protein S18 acetylase RimI-like enzyme
MGLTIRRATLADADVLVAFNAALAWETERKGLDEGALRTGVRAVFADPAKGFYTVAEDGGEVVGQVMVTFEWSDWRDGWYWWVQSVYVRADPRRGGVFRALFDHLQAQAMADPTVIGLRLYVEGDNVVAQRTYSALGMDDAGYRIFETGFS